MLATNANAPAKTATAPTDLPKNSTIADRDKTSKNHFQDLSEVFLISLLDKIIKIDRISQETPCVIRALCVKVELGPRFPLSHKMISLENISAKMPYNAKIAEEMIVKDLANLDVLLGT